MTESRAVPQWPFISADGRIGGFVRTASRQPRGDVDGAGGGGIFIGPLDGQARRLECGLPSVPPVLSPSGRHLLLAEAKEESTLVSVARLTREPPLVAPLAEVPGSVQQLLWDEHGQRALALVAEPGSDTASLTSGRRGPRPVSGPEVDEGIVGAQQLWSISLARGGAALLGPPSLSIWEMALAPGGALACVCSPPGENNWYHAYIGRVDLRSGAVERLYSPQWQVAWLAVDSGTGRTAFAEGWASDRGLVAGEVVVLGPTGAVERRYPDLPVDVTWLQWDDKRRLFYGGWRDLGVAWGWIDQDGVAREPNPEASLLGSPWRPWLALSADGGTAVACVSDDAKPPHVVVISNRDGRRVWAPADGAPIPELSVCEGAWSGPDGLEIHGILLVPSAEVARAGNNGALVVLIHGGPTLAYHHAFDLASSHRLVREGFSVLLPNPRGSAGRGQDFARGNFGDPGGAELDDVLAGAGWALRSGLVPTGKPAVMGSSYGGYLSALAAAARPHEVTAAVVGAGISDLASCRHTCNNPAFYDLVLGGLPTAAGARRLCVERSAVYLARGEPAPTLILHGEEDRCVPVSQAHELFNALRGAGGEVEMAVYQREGHQIAEPAHLADYWARTVRWLSAHRSPGGAGL